MGHASEHQQARESTQPRGRAAAALAEARERLDAIANALAALDGRLTTARDGNGQALADLGARLQRELEKLDASVLRLDALGSQLRQNSELLKVHDSRLEDNSAKIYEILIDIDAMKKALVRMRHAYEQMRAARAKTNRGVTAGDDDQHRPGLLLPLVLSLLVPLAVVVNQGEAYSTAIGARRGDVQVSGVLIAWFVGGAGFFLLGIGILYGPSLGGVIGNPFHFLGKVLLSSPQALSPALLERLVPNLILASVVAVVACSSAPRGLLTNLGYSLVALVTATFLYPLLGHWIATPSDLSAHSGWLAGPASACSAATIDVALLGGILALSLAGGLGLVGTPSGKGSPPSPPGNRAAVGAMLLWIAWIGVILVTNPDCLPLTALALSFGATAGGAALGVFLIEGVTASSPRWRNRLPFAVLAGVVAAPAGPQTATLVELAVLGALTGVSASLLMRFFARRSLADVGLALALSVGGIFGTLAPVLFGATGLLRLHSLDFLAPQIKATATALLLGLVAGRALAWVIGSMRFLRTPA